MSSCTSLMVVGGGVMGQGIARLFSGVGISVTLVEPRDISFSHPGVTVAHELPSGPVPELVIEAVFEDRNVKQAVYADIERLYEGRPVLATNTSGLPLTNWLRRCSIPSDSSRCTSSCQPTSFR